MRIIHFIVTICVAVNIMACTSNTNSANNDARTTEVINQAPEKVVAPTVNERPAKTVATMEVAENTVDKKTVEATKKQVETTTKEVPAKAEKKDIPKPKKVVEKVKANAEKAASEVKASTVKATETVKETVKPATTAVTEVPAKVTETVKEVVATPPPAPKPVTKPEAPKVVKKVTTAPKVETPKVEAPTPKVETPPAPPAPAQPALSHSIFDGLLRQHVSASGAVNYTGFKADKAKLQSYLDILAANPPKADWGRGKAMAYWINAYNAFTIKLIVDNYPLGSITDLDGGNPWDKSRIKLGGQTYSLNQIEKEILLKKYKDARVHFAVNCAAKSCPALLNSAWTASNLESNFERQTKAFINNTQFNDIKAKSAKVSKIFEWYADDFGDVKAFINKYANTQLKPNAKIEYMEYNWKLNQ